MDESTSYGTVTFQLRRLDEDEKDYEEEKRKKRAERFGVAEIEAATAPPAKKAKAEPEITDPKLLARAERFKAATDSAAA